MRPSLWISFAVVALVGCGQTPKLARLGEEEADAVKSLAPTNRAGIDVLLDELKAKPNENVMVSPASLAEATSLLRLGTAGVTDRELGKALGLSMSSDEAGKAYASLRKSWQPLLDSGVLGVADGVWVHQGADIKREFLDATRSGFDAEARVGRSEPETIKDINQWVNDRTRGRIPEMLQSLGAWRVVVVNALAFKDEWKDKFDKSRTEPKPFHLPDGKSVNVPFMASKSKRNSMRTEEWAGVTIPYRSGLEMRIVMPWKPLPLAALLSDRQALWVLTNQGWAQRPSFFEESEVSMPRWTSSTSIDLMSWFTKVAPSIVKPSSADFTKLSSESELFLTLALQKTFILVDEEGTEAAAATHEDVGKAAAPMPTGPIVIDHPFLYSILDPQSGIVLFLGVMNDPR